MIFHCVFIKKLRRKLNYFSTKDGKETRKPVTDGIRSKRNKKEKEEVQNTKH